MAKVTEQLNILVGTPGYRLMEVLNVEPGAENYYVLCIQFQVRVRFFVGQSNDIAGEYLPVSR